MTKEEFDKTVELLSYKISENTARELLNLNHTLRNARVLSLIAQDLKSEGAISQSLVHILKNKIGYNVIKHVFDECEFYNTLAERSDIWETMEAYFHEFSMSFEQSVIFRDVILPGLVKYANNFTKEFHDFYLKCKEAGYLEG